MRLRLKKVDDVELRRDGESGCDAAVGHAPHGAVSRTQLQRLGVRRGRDLRLTDDGRRYAAVVRVYQAERDAPVGGRVAGHAGRGDLQRLARRVARYVRYLMRAETDAPQHIRQTL